MTEFTIFILTLTPVLAVTVNYIGKHRKATGKKVGKLYYIFLYTINTLLFIEVITFIVILYHGSSK